MMVDEKLEDMRKGNETEHAWSVSMHAFSDLSHVSPLMFLYLLKESYFCGTLKASTKFRALQGQVHCVLSNGPLPGPAIFIARCLFILPIFEIYSEGLCHLILSALRRFLKNGTTQDDILEAKSLAAKLFIQIVQKSPAHDEKILMKILEVFEVNLSNIEEVIQHMNVNIDRRSIVSAKEFVEWHIFNLIESQSYMTAVALLKQFSIRESGKSFLVQMLENKQYKAAEKWATFMGKPMLNLLVREYIERNQQQFVCGIIKRNKLQEEFPELYKQCKENSLKKLAEKGCWDVAEAKTKGNRQLLEYVVYLALEAGYLEKVEEICSRYSLEGFMNVKEPNANLVQSCTLRLDELCVEDVVWVDEIDGLHTATCQIEESKLVGLDCEWKPNYIKGNKPNKVSIMQIASETKVYILDLIKLHGSAPDILDDCLTRILHSPRILKLGYNFKCDVQQLSHSYEDLKCFKHYEMLLDIQNVFKEYQGGLSGLALKVLGRSLNKTRRNSDWEQRPLSVYQLEYAALDAVVLVHIFRHVRDHQQPVGIPDENIRIEWKSHIVSHMDNPQKGRKGAKSRKQNDARVLP